MVGTVRMKRPKTVINILFSCLLLVSLVFGLARPVLAATACPTGMSQLDCDALFGGWVNWVPNDGSTNCAATLGTTLLGSDNVSKAFNYFLQKGLSPIATSGLIGNLMEESSVVPQKVQGGSLAPTPPIDANTGWGIAQWTGVTIQQNLVASANSQNRKVDDLGFQLDFLWQQLNSNPTYYELPQLKAATSPAQAADIFEAGFERAGSPNLSVREADAQQAFTQFGGNPVTSGGATGVTATSGGCNTVASGTNTKYVNGFTIFDQCDPQWAKNPYGGDNICGSGCGPTSMAMAITNLSGHTVTPAQTAAYAMTPGSAGPGQTEIDPTGGSKWSIAPDLATHWGLKATAIGSNVAAISATLSAGGLVVVAGTGGVPFTTGGHYIVIRAIAADGKWLLGDPDTAAGHSSTIEWDPAAVVAAGMEAGSAYAITK